MSIATLHAEGLAHLRAGRLAEADRVYRAILAQDVNNVEALLHLGILFSMSGKLQPAIELTSRAASLRPDAPPILMNLGRIQGLAGQGKQAQESYRRVIQLQPGLADAHECLGELLLADKNFAEAMVHLRRAVAIDARRASAHNLLGVGLSKQGHFTQAIECFDRALRLQPNFAHAHHNRGVACIELGRTDEAFNSFDRAADIFPDLASKLKSILFTPEIMPSVAIIERTRQRIERHLVRLSQGKFTLTDPERTLDAMPFLLAYHGENDRPLQALLARLLLQSAPGLGEVAPHCSKPRPPRSASDRIKIGFVSQNFYYHTIGRLNAGLIHLLDRDRFEVMVFRVPGKRDWLADQIRDRADMYIELAPDLPTARQQIAGRELDVLYYPDIGMDMLPYLLAFARLAPVQCVGWGHPVTTGIPNIDYFMSSVDLEPDGADGHYTERLVKLKSLTCYYYRPALSPPLLTRADFGLSPDHTLYVCPQTLFKLHPDFDAIFQAILRTDPRARVVLLKGLDPNWSALLLQRFKRTIPDVVDRILFLEFQSTARFLHLLANCDVMLDPIRFGGGNTSLEGFAVGIPIVTLAGGFLRGRLTYAMYRMMGLDDLVAADTADYIARAVRLGTDPAYRQSVKDKILAHNGVLYENAAAVRELEKFLIDAVTAIPGRPGRPGSPP